MYGNERAVLLASTATVTRTITMSKEDVREDNIRTYTSRQYRIDEIGPGMIEILSVVSVGGGIRVDGSDAFTSSG